MWKNPVATAIVGLMLGFFAGYLIGQGGGAAAAAGGAGNPPAGVQGAPALDGAPVQPPSGGRTAASSNPRLMEQARDLEAVLAKNPGDYTTLVEMGNVQYDMSNFVSAADYYERARKIKDDSADVLTDLGVCYRETKQPDKAVELFDRAADMSPAHWQSRYNAAVVRLFDLNDPKGAQEELTKLKSLGAAVSGMPDLTSLEQEIAARLK